MSKLIRLITGLLLLVVAFYEDAILKQLKNIDLTPNKEVVVVNITPPSEANKSLTKQVQDFVIDANDAQKIYEFYSQLAKMIREDADKEVIVQNKSFRDWYMNSGSLNFTPALKGKYIGLSTAIDAVLIGTLGEEDIKWTPQIRKSAADVCDAIAWAVYQ